MMPKCEVRNHAGSPTAPSGCTRSVLCYVLFTMLDFGRHAVASPQRTLLAVVAAFALSMVFGQASVHAALAVANGNMEAPAVGAWSTNSPTSWTWTKGAGSGAVGLTSTGGANGTTQTLWGNNILGTLTSATLSENVPGPGSISLSYWVKKLNTGSVNATANLLLGGSTVASRVTTLSSETWTQYTVNYEASASDAGKSVQVQFVFSNGSGAWQGYLDEVALTFQPGINFVGSSSTVQDTESSVSVPISLTGASADTVSVVCSKVGGTAVEGTDFDIVQPTLSIAPGATTGNFDITIHRREGYQGKRSIVLGLVNPVNAAVGSAGTYTITIVDPEDKPAPVTYYLDSAAGNDANSGTSSDAAWKSLGKANSVQFNPGDKILLKAGSVWTGQLTPQGSGDSTAPITIDMYGTGAKPRINAGGINGGAVNLYNQEYWSINNLEVTNTGDATNPKKQGILIVNDCVGTLSGIEVKNCYVHNVDGVMAGYVDGKESGGIVFKITGSNLNVPSKWTDITIENNTIENVIREGILLQSQWVNKPQDSNTYWPGCGNYYPSSNVRIAGNTLNVIGGDGIIPWAVDGGMVEHNYVADCNTNTPGQGHAAVWPYICANIIFQYNEVCRTRTTYDGMAFDFDNSNQNCIYQYNYSHDNEGGFLNLCSWGNSNGNIARYNISQNDGCASGGRVFLIDGPGNNNALVYNNTIYVKNSNPEMFHQGATSTSSTIYFYNNIFVNAGSGAVTSPGGCTFDNNLFYGNGSIAADANKIIADPQLAGPGSATTGLASVFGYKLLTTSPALAKGKLIANNGGADYWGNAVSATALPNLGAYNGTGFTGWQWNPAGTNGPSDGSGTWDNTSTNWWDGDSVTTWPGTAMTAIFGAGTGAAGQVTITGSNAVGSLTFNPPGSGSYTISGGSLTLSSPTITANANATISSVLLGTGLTKSGNGTLTLTGTNTYTGPTTINAGTLAVVNGGRIYSPGWQPYVTTVNNGATLLTDNWAQGLMSDYAAANLVLNGGKVTYTGSETALPTNPIVGSYGRAFSVGALGGTLESKATSGYVWAITRYNAANAYPLGALGGTLTLGGTGDGYISKAISGTGGIVKSGAGTWTLAGTNVYTGATTINGGTLKLGSGGSIAGTTKITVSSGATFDASSAGFTVRTNQTLAGGGSVSGIVTLAAGTSAIDLKDDAADTLQLLSGLALNSGNVLSFDVGGISDEIFVGGSYTAPSSGTATINIAAISSFGAGTFPLIVGAGGISAGSFTLGSVPSGHLYALIVSGNTLSLVVDGIEAWRQAHFNTTDNAGAAADNADPDGDGWTNTREFAAGTDPNDKSSSLKFSQMQRSGGDYTLNFATVLGKKYRVERRDSLEAGAWEPVVTDQVEQTNIDGTGGTISVTDTGGALATKRFYRIVVQ